ncbi:MAG: ABC transporter permease [Saprospiraceae bacterium]|nr:ABC transporter permease [Saprospiraceae bacterium]
MNRSLVLAWRNIWRNKRRTLISAASVAFAVLFSVSVSSLQKGGWDRMLDNVVRFYFGYAQVHAAGYSEEQTIDRSMAMDADRMREWEGALGGRQVVPRLESFALASTGPATVGVLLSGIDPEREDAFTGLAARVVKGAYLQPDEQGLLVSAGIATDLGVGVGDTVILLSQGYQSATADGKYAVTGIVSFGSPDLNKLMVFLPLAEAQYFFGAEGRATSFVLDLEGQDEVPGALAAMRGLLDPEVHEVLGWEELIPDLVQARAFDEAGSVIVLIILYLIIAFGLFGTVLMMTKEREYEFGVLIAIGMRRGQLTGILWAEVLFLSLMGALAGMAMALPVVAWFQVNPIVFTGEMADVYEKFGVEPVMPTVVDARIFLVQGATIFLLAAAMAVYPWLRIRSLSPVTAMRH